MLILTIRTDNPHAELGLFNDQEQISYIKYNAHRTLGETIHTQIKDMLSSNNFNWHDIEGIICFEGPGSFTGLRIGTATANALSYGLGIPIVGTDLDNWISVGVDKLLIGENMKQVLPNYGREPHITEQKK